MYIIGKKCGEKMKDYSEYFKGPNLKEAQKRSRKQVDHLKDAFEIPSDMVSIGKGKTYYIHTYGCQANERDGETLAGIFEMMGYTAAKEIEEADVILLNTCAIRENAEEKVFGKVGYVKNLKKKNPNLIFGLCGCMAQEEVVIKRILEKHPHIDLIFGTHNIHRLPTLLKEAMFSKEMVVEVWSKEGDVIENTPVTRANGHKAWVNIMYGCNKFCTYCIVPYTRGKERSRLMDDIIEEVKGLKADGYQEITLLGQNVNSYGKDLEEDYDFATLLEEVAKTGIARIRFTTSHPWDFSREMIEIINQYDNIMPYIHLPVQSGNTDSVLGMAKYIDTYFLVIIIVFLTIAFIACGGVAYYEAEYQKTGIVEPSGIIFQLQSLLQSFMIAVIGIEFYNVQNCGSRINRVFVLCSRLSGVCGDGFCAC